MKSIPRRARGFALILAVFLIGETPGTLADALPDAERVPLPEGVFSTHLAAYGAALAPLRPDVGGGFSLRTSAEAALEREQDRRWKLVTGIAAGIAVFLALGAFLFAGWTAGEKATRARALGKVAPPGGVLRRPAPWLPECCVAPPSHAA